MMLFEFTKKLIEDNFNEVGQKLQYEKMVIAEATKILDSHKGFEQTNITIIANKIENAL